MAPVCRAPRLTIVPDSTDEISTTVAVSLPNTAPAEGWSLVTLTACAKQNATVCPGIQQCPVLASGEPVVCDLDGLEPSTSYVVQVSWLCHTLHRLVLRLFFLHHSWSASLWFTTLQAVAVSGGTSSLAGSTELQTLSYE